MGSKMSINEKFNISNKETCSLAIKSKTKQFMKKEIHV